MNIGHDLMRRFGPRREPLRDEHPRPARAEWVLAAFMLAVGGAAIAGLAVAGFRSPEGARIAIPLCLSFVGGYGLYRVIRRLASPGFDQTTVDAADLFDRGFLRRNRFGGPPVQVALALLAAAALWAALAVMKHHR